VTALHVASLRCLRFPLHTGIVDAETELNFLIPSGQKLNIYFGKGSLQDLCQQYNLSVKELASITTG
tara:strand:+ start:339 stop:539 length:201 start_codon:yes stop_codon:yes gene_type:complete